MMGSKNLIPSFNYFKDTNNLRLSASEEAKSFNKKLHCFGRPLNVVHENALQSVTRLEGDNQNRLHVLGQYTIEFGKYQGSTFKWLFENDMGWTINIAASHKVR